MSIGIVSIGLLAILVGLAAPPTIQSVIRTKRLEIYDDKGKIVMMASADPDSGGQLNMWNQNGINSARVGANSNGGELYLWNKEQQQVFRAYAMDDSGHLEVNSNDAMIAHITGNSNGGMMRLYNEEGRVLIENACTSEGGEIFARHTTHQGMVAIKNTSDGGHIKMTDAMATAGIEFDSAKSMIQGQTQSRPGWSIQAGADGNRIDFMGDNGDTRLGVGSQQDRFGILVKNQEGATVAAIGASAQDCGEIQLSNSNGNNEVVLAADPLGGQIILSDSSANPFLLATSSEEGGRLEMFDAEGETVTSMVGFSSGGGRFAAGIPGSSTSVLLEAMNDSGILGLRSRDGHSLSAQARPTGSMLVIRDGGGGVGLLLGSGPSGSGSELSLRNSKGKEVVLMGETADGDGEISLINSDQSRMNTWSAPEDE